MQFKMPDFECKIMSPDNLLRICKANRNEKLIFTNGCFDIIHRGHVTYLAQAKSIGGKLIVALNTDDSVKRQGKGESRPINSLANRMAVIASLMDVDYVTYFDSDTPYDLIINIMPDVLVKGGDWSIDKIVGSKEVINNGGKVYSIPFLYDTSTTKIIRKIQNV